MKNLISFILVTLFFAVGIHGFRMLSGREKWELTKVIFYALMCSILSVMTLTTIVILF